MKKLTIFVVICVVIAGISIGVYALVKPLLSAWQQETVVRETSDAARLEHTIRVAGDGWVGYSVIRSPEFARYLESDLIGLSYTDDKADYPGRMAKLAAGEYDVIVATLDAYLLNAKPHAYPGVILFVVDESKGGDGIVAKKDVDSLQSLARPGMKIAVTPNSPSEFLLRAVASHFDLAPLKVAGPWRKEAEGSSGALKDLKAGTVDAAVLWEPELTDATSDARFHKLLGTEQTQGLILDVCIARREFIADNPDLA
ncbi:transporter substrate-binding domain-containing protein, partial [Candidatus Poribacteria bacterium]|nr:transporter substrate-binding domain-containing protein [Candidatus Poribacteria bacterium]